MAWLRFVRPLLVPVRWSARSLAARSSRLEVWLAVQFLSREPVVIAPSPQRRREAPLLLAAMQTWRPYLPHRPVSVFA